MFCDDVRADGIDHAEGAIGAVIAVDVLRTDVDGKELRAEHAFDAREVGLATLTRGRNVVAGDGFAGYVVMRVDEDGVARDAIDFGLGNGPGLRGLRGDG